MNTYIVPTAQYNFVDVWSVITYENEEREQNV